MYAISVMRRLQIVMKRIKRMTQRFWRWQRGEQHGTFAPREENIWKPESTLADDQVTVYKQTFCDTLHAILSNIIKYDTERFRICTGITKESLSYGRLPSTSSPRNPPLSLFT